MWKGGEKVALVEGATREMPKDYQETVRAYGEAGSLYWFAREAQIEVIRPEPNDEEQRKSLCASFPPDLVAYAVIIQNLAASFRHTDSINFNEVITRVLNRETKFSEIYGFLPDRPWFEGQHKKLFDEQKLEDKNFLDSIVDPRKDNTVINGVVALRSKLRNEYILSVIKKMWEARKNIFIVYGKGHLFSLEQPLKELVLEA